MNKENAFIGLLWVIVVAVVLWAIYKTLNHLADYAPAVIAALATIYVALLNHALAGERELRMHQQKERQENYKELLGAAAQFIRQPNDKDAVDTVRLYSWVVGSESVIKATQLFTAQKDQKSLRPLLDEMRKEIGLEKISKDLELGMFSKKEIGYLSKDAAAPQATESKSSSPAEGAPTIKKRSFWSFR